MKVKCYSVRLESLTRISPACYRARAFDGSEALIPSSQVYGDDEQVSKSDAWWISAWILEKKSIQYSSKKEAWFDSETGRMLPTFIITHHIPDRVEPVESNSLPHLKR